ncbi:MAG: imelysin family protein [Byssovorax sp.]
MYRSRSFAPALALLALLVPFLGGAGCSADNDLVLADAALDAQAAADGKAYLVDRVEALHDHLEALCKAAPAPAADGWVSPRDTPAIQAMRASWHEARRAHQALEGVLLLHFPDLAASLDGSYEDALAAGPDPELVDDRGFTGLHAIERILWADRMPAGVAKEEAALPGALPAAFPSTEEQAIDFRDELCAGAVHDAEELEAAIEGLPLGSPEIQAIARELVEIQADRVIEAGEGHPSSPYAGRSLLDLTDGLAAARAMHEVFLPWLATKAEGPHVAAEAADAFDRLAMRYMAAGVDALPAPPSGWSDTAYNDEQLQSPFGLIFMAVMNETNLGIDGSVAHSVEEAGALLGVDGD